jgi:predicted TIM-barrel fold metal-dependent hydrolase
MNELRLPLFLDAAEAPAFADLPALCRDYPDMPVVLLRQPFNSSRALTPLLEKLPNFYLDIAITVDTGYLEELAENRCGSEKLLFGSGMPLFEPSGALGLVMYSALGQRDKENILSANWERLEGGIRYDTP